MCMKMEYLIGDVARMTGLSRDALRFYEKKGIISSRKKENGYRCYSENDIYRLMCILYHRKMNTSLEDIEGLMSGRISVPDVERHIDQRMEEEQEQMRQHRRNLIRLQLARRDMEKIEENRDQYSVRSFPKAYILKNCPDLQEGLKEWFRLAGQVEGLDMTYFFSRLSLKDRKLEERGTQIFLYKGMEKYLGPGFCGREYPMTKQTNCINTVVLSEDTRPDVRVVENMLRWGRDNGMEPEEAVYVNIVSSFLGEEKNRHYLELFMPVA